MASTARKKVATVGPGDAGRRMTLDRFADADVEPGYLYELAEG